MKNQKSSSLFLAILILFSLAFTSCVCNSYRRSVYRNGGGCSDSGFCYQGVPEFSHYETVTVCEGWFNTTQTVTRN